MRTRSTWRSWRPRGRAALAAGVGLDEVAGWCRLPAGDLVQILAQPQDDGQDEDGTAPV
ncbi:MULTISPECIES: MerR family transcriptional regulator [Streptomyces]|uniref:hypothetical protein n=1 Tax=Streptomyces TaxID=1883 RepID=UPI003631F17D